MLRVQRNGAAERRVKRRRGIAAGQARAGIKAHSRQTLALAQIGAKHARVHSFYIIGGYEVVYAVKDALRRHNLIDVLAHIGDLAQERIAAT